MSCMFVPNFKAIGQVTSVLEPENRPATLGVKSGLSQKRLKYGKKYFIGLYVSRYPFIPTNPLLAAMSGSFLFFPFFLFLIFVRTSPKPQHIEI